MVITIDGNKHEIEAEGRNLLDICLSLGYDLPYFCWHPAMHSVGACRQCAVKWFQNDKDTRGRIIMACMSAPVDGMIVSINDPEAAAFRKSVAEWLMLNHPHDCPVCDEGGECHLQDMTIMARHAYRRTRVPKRTHHNQDLGPFINHEMNRCIQCYRCVRFYRDYAGGHDFGVFGWHDGVYFGRHEDGTLENEFSGNLVEVCPTGVFTDKTFRRHYTRKWDLQTAPSICVHCGLGCNILPGERYGTLRRIQSRYNHDVNGYFLCDRGRFGYDFVNGEQRVRTPRLRATDSDRFDEIEPVQALKVLAEWLRGHEVIGLGSPRASIESNFALRQFVGEGNFYQGISESNRAIQAEMLRIMREGSAPTISLGDVGRCDAALIFGDDVANTAPMLALALRQTVLQAPIRRANELHLYRYDDSAIREAIQVEKGPLYIAYPAATKLDWLARQSFRATPPDIARLGYAIAHALDDQAPAVEDISEELRATAARIAGELSEAECPVIVAGYACGDVATTHAAANIAWALQRQGSNARLCFTMPRCNSLGLALLGGPSLDDALERVDQTRDLVVIVLEGNLHREINDADADRLLQAAGHVVVLDYLENETTRSADLILPAAAFAESTGTFVNNEGRAQRHFQVFVPGDDIRESWRWIADMAEVRGEQRPWECLDDLILAADELPGLQGIAEAAPLSDYRLAGQKIPREPHRYSGRTAMHADKTVQEPAPPVDADAPLGFSMEGSTLQPPPELISRFWSPGWNSQQAVNRFQDRIAGPLRGGPAGRRLIEPSGDQPDFYGHVPPAFAPREGHHYVIPIHHVFGSDELSMQSPGIAERAPQPYLALNAADLALFGANAGDMLALRVHDMRVELPAALRPELPDGVAGLGVGLPGMPGVCLPGWGRITLAGAGEADE